MVNRQQSQPTTWTCISTRRAWVVDKQAGVKGAQKEVIVEGTWECPNCGLTMTCTSSIIPPMACGWCNWGFAVTPRTREEALAYRDRLAAREAAVATAKAEAKRLEKDLYYYSDAAKLVMAG